jgi:hypothetical protein
VGLSLDDNTLKNLLRQNARINPGNFHYYIYHVTDHALIKAEEKAAIEDTNFEIYNLITLFLTSEEIAALGAMLAMKPSKDGNQADEFEELCKLVERKFVFYVVGCVSSGKTTAISHFRALHVFDEWLEPRIPEIIKPSDRLNDKEREAADAWVIRQIGLKNRNLAHETAGIHLIDRAPLDPFAFTATDKWKDKATRIEKEVCDGKPPRPLENGHIILLEAEPKELALRMRSRGNPADETYLQKQKDLLTKIYSGPGVTKIQTTQLAPEIVAGDIAKAIFRNDYVPFDCQARLADLKANGYV